MPDSFQEQMIEERRAIDFLISLSKRINKAVRALKNSGDSELDRIKEELVLVDCRISNKIDAINQHKF